MKYYIIAGEASGDLHAASLVKKIAELDAHAEFKGVGGEKLKEANVELLFGLERLAFMGFYEVIKNLRTVRKNFLEVKKDILSFKPDVVILTDYPGFNLRMSKWSKQNGFKVAYFISPQIWAWNEKRVEIIKKYVDLVLCVLPFEKAFYEKHGYPNAHFIGHPLMDVRDEHQPEVVSGQKTIALLPGSRKQEIRKLLPLMLKTAREFPAEKFVIAGISRLKELYTVELPENVSIVFDKSAEVLHHSKAAVVCSGTATLETALLHIPQVVVYKTSWLNYQIGKRLSKVDFISLPNLIAGEKIVEELIQDDCTVERISVELKKLLHSPISQSYNSLIEKIGEKGASAKAAALIFNLAR
ncbi:MAG: Lipid-A-disaccharide synthase [Bacteroidota bacterium]|nr:Lipid-A-disaccharide synthase [Bacteroidota bacterium]